MKFVFIWAFLASILTLTGCEKNAAPSSNKVVLTATNLDAVEMVIDWSMRDRTKGKVINDTNNLRRSQIVFPDGMKFLCVGNYIGAIITSNGEEVLFEYDSQRRLSKIIFPDKSAQVFTFSDAGDRPTSMESNKTNK